MVGIGVLMLALGLWSLLAALAARLYDSAMFLARRRR